MNTYDRIKTLIPVFLLVCSLLLHTGVYGSAGDNFFENYCTRVRLLEDVELSLYHPAMFRFRTSYLEGEKFPPRYEIPFVIGKLENWPPVVFTKWNDEQFIYVKTGSLLIKFGKTGRTWEVWSLDGKNRLYPSNGPVYGMFRDGYTLFDNASAFNEFNKNSRYSHWFYNPETKNYVDTYLEEDLIADQYFIYGPQYEKIFALFNQLVGPEPLLPKKAYGFFQTQHLGCEGNQEKLMAVARKLREREIPCDYLIVDFEWGDGCDGKKEIKWGSRLDWSPNYTAPLSPEEMIRQLHDLHFDVMLIHHNAPGFANRKHQGWTETVVDETTWWRKLKEKLDIGVDGTWQDTRRNDITDSVIWKGLQNYFGTSRRVLLMGCRKMQLTNPWDNYFCSLPMNQMIGARRYPFDWTGDCSYSWRELAWQIKAITNTHGSMKGVSYITSDAVGAHWKIQARWNQFADFSVISRSHHPKPWSGNIRVKDFVDKIRITGRDHLKNKNLPKEPDPDTGINNETGEKTTAEKSILKHRKLRYRLMPYIYSYAHVNFRTGMPICRPMMLAYLQDHKVNGDQWPYQYMFGQWLLVAPVYGDFNTMEIYLPAGDRWIDYWSNDVYEGGGILRYDVSDIDKLPLFVREGAILAMRQDSLWLDPAAPDQLSFEIYPGKNSEFVLYEDDGVTTLYRQGEYSAMPIRCASSKTEIHIAVGAATGNFGGMQKQRSYRLVVKRMNKAPRKVTVNDISLEQKKSPGNIPQGCWFHGTSDNSLVIRTGRLAASTCHNVVITKN